MIYFSLIVPIYNAPQDDRRGLLDELLESLPDRGDLEVLLVDDHSSLQYTPACRHSKIEIHVLQNDIGKKFAGSARNVGIEKAKGEYVIFADSDDKFSTEGFSRVLEELIQDKETDLAIGRSSSFLENGETGSRHHHVDKILDRFCQSHSSDHLISYHAPWGKVIRKSLIDKNGLKFQSTRVANDVIFGVKLALACKSVKIFDEVIYHIREGNASLTSDASNDAVEIRLKVARDVHDELLAAGKGDLRAPLHYQFRHYMRTHPKVVVRQMLKSLLRGDRIVAPPTKMIRTLLKALKH